MLERDKQRENWGKREREKQRAGKKEKERKERDIDEHFCHKMCLV